MKYIILSLKHGCGSEPVFWKANAMGYTNSPFNAGIYTEDEVSRDPAYYNDGYNSLAIPLTDAAMSKLGFTCSYNESELKHFMQKSKGQ